MVTSRIFLFGTLRHAPLLRLVAGRDVPAHPARLPGARVERARFGDWPVLVAAEGSEAEGLLVEVDDDTLARLDFYEAVYGYARAPVTLGTAAGEVAAQAWRPRAAEPGSGEPWVLDDWAARWAPVTLEAAGDILRRMGSQAPERAGAFAGIIRARADAVLRTRAWHRERRIGTTLGSGDVEIVGRLHPYDGFYAMEELTARHRRFDGQTQREVVRAVFRVADAATVLPYDPVRDRVLFVEQLRFGPLAAGDPAPWLLEPVAGLIDAGETPEETARREAAEEAGLVVGDLHFVARYYPTPGGVAHVLYSYVGIADLPDEAAGLGGHADEDEDILGHVVGYAEAMELLAAGDLVNAPAIMSLQWLAANRDRLRAAQPRVSAAG
ncbi:gamma-glutamylcyclotransferase [Roseicyclus sp.]|uniref:gamma-glutamylcyclotransferase n=1 Tax=Roseicyclus sp. TaxID=1914329 RepID=UPI003F9F392B